MPAINRPDKVYLDSPVEMVGKNKTIHKVGHTQAGLVFMIDHLNATLELSLEPSQLSDANRQYIHQLIALYTVHLSLYQNARPTDQTTPAPNVLPDNLQPPQVDDFDKKAGAP